MFSRPSAQSLPRKQAKTSLHSTPECLVKTPLTPAHDLRERDELQSVSCLCVARESERK